MATTPGVVCTFSARVASPYPAFARPSPDGNWRPRKRPHPSYLVDRPHAIPPGIQAGHYLGSQLLDDAVRIPLDGASTPRGAEYVYGTSPNDFLRSQVAHLPRGRILCLAEGEGRNAVFLSEQGYHVTAVDQSQVGLAKARQLADQRDVTIDTVIVEPREAGIMTRPPREPGQALLTRTLVFRVLLVSVLMVLASRYLFEWEVDNGAT